MRGANRRKNEKHRQPPSQHARRKIGDLNANFLGNRNGGNNFFRGTELGLDKQTSSTLDEIHTGSLWEMARLKYCGDDPDALPLALICFYDKTNTDVFSSLS